MVVNTIQSLLNRPLKSSRASAKALAKQGLASPPLPISPGMRWRPLLTSTLPQFARFRQPRRSNPWQQRCRRSSWP